MSKKPYFIRNFKDGQEAYYSRKSSFANSIEASQLNCVNIEECVRQQRDNPPGRGLMGRCFRAELAPQISEKQKSLSPRILNGAF